MYPNTYFSLFPPFPRNNKIFVAMSFDQKFTSRWDDVIVPAIKSVKISGVPLQPYRVDLRHIGDSILTEILDGITNDLLILADLSTIGYLDEKPIRNGNVMYEIGLAQSIRLPEEVILFRSDSDRLLFDVTNVRINSYDPEANILESQQKVISSIRESLNELDLRRQISIKKAANSLDYDCLLVLLLAGSKGVIKSFPMRTMRDVMSFSSKNAAINKLLELGALETEYLVLNIETIRQSLEESVDQILQYRVTKFGRAITGYIINSIEYDKLVNEVHNNSQ